MSDETVYERWPTVRWDLVVRAVNATIDTMDAADVDAWSVWRLGGSAAGIEVFEDADDPIWVHVGTKNRILVSVDTYNCRICLRDVS